MKKKVLDYIIVFLILIIIAVLVLKYIDNKRLSKTTFNLKGSSNITLNINDTWTDPGFVYEYDGVDKSNEVSIDGSVDLKTVGEYKINYSVKVGFQSLNLTRQVNVLDASEKADLSFSLNGDSIYYLMNGKEYIEPGAKAYDLVDGDISSHIKKTGDIKNNQNGTYQLLYTVSNSNGVTKSITRKVIVYSFKFEGKIKYDGYKTSNEIVIKISDDKYDYTVLPSGQTTKEKVINYIVKENDVYNFTFFDLNHNSQIYSIEVNNIDVVKPTGSCVLSLYDVGGQIEVKANDNIGVNEYKYFYGKNVSNGINTNIYRISTMDDEASVEISDLAGNTTKINCSVVDKSTVIPSGYNSYSKSSDNKLGYWLYMPKNNTKRQKKTLLIYLHGGGSHGNGTSQLSRINNYAFPLFAKKGIDMPFIMVAPQSPLDANFASSNMVKNVKELIDNICQNYNVDVNKIVISGGSLGAKGVYAMVSNYKGFFAGALIGSGVLDTDVSMSDMTSLPVLYVHGISDSISISSVEKRVDQINSLGGNAKIIRANGGHEITETALKEKYIFDWIINQSK